MKKKDEGLQARLVPRLRPDLEWLDDREDTEGWHWLVDRKFNRRLKLDGRGRVIASLLDRDQSLGELQERIATVSGRPIELEALHKVLDYFGQLGLLESGANARHAAEREFMEQQAAEGCADMPLIVPDDLRFTCQACGDCCVGVNVSPVTPDTVAGVEAHASELIPRGIKKAPFFTMLSDHDQKEIVVCQTLNGQCIFLDDDGLCRIHRKFGAEAKPAVCRLFPYKFVVTPRGVVVSLQLECRNILKASKGQPLKDQEPMLRKLMAAHPGLVVTRSFVSLDGKTAIDESGLLRLEEELGAAMRGSRGDGFSTLVRGRRVIRRWCAELSEPFPKETDDVKALKQSLYRLLQRIGSAMTQLKRNYTARGRHLRFHTENLDTVLEAISSAPQFMTAILSRDRGESGRFGRLAVRNALLGREEANAAADLLGAFGFMALRWFLAKAVAVSRSRQVHRRKPRPQDVVDGYIVMSMLGRNHRFKKYVASLRDEVVRLFVYDLEALLEHAKDLEVSSSMTDFYLF